MSDRLFLTTEEVAELTGRIRHAQQIDALKKMHVPFRINAAGRPIVTRAAIIGGQIEKPKPETKGWQPKVLAA